MRESIEKQVEDSYFSQENKLPNIKKRISNHVLQSRIIPSIVKELSVNAKSLTEKQATILLEMIWKSLDQNYEKIKDQRSPVQNITDLIMPIFNLAIDKNWLKQLDSLNLSTQDLQNLTKEWQKTKHSKEQSPVFELLMNLKNKAKIIKDSFSKQDQPAILENIFFKMREDLQKLPNDLLPKIEILIKNFPDNKDPTDNLTKQYLESLRDSLYAKKADEEITKTTIQELESTREDLISLYKNSDIKDDFLSLHIFRLNEAMKISAEIETIYGLFNQFTRQAAIFLINLPEVEARESYQKILEAFEKLTIQYLVSQVYVFSDPQKTELSTSDMLTSLTTIEANISDHKKALENQVDEQIRELETLITHCFKYQDEKNTFLQTVMFYLLSEDKNENEKTLVQLGTSRRDFTKDSRYKPGSLTKMDHNKIIQTGDSRKLRAENIEEITKLSAKIKKNYYLLKTFPQPSETTLKLQIKATVSSFANERQDRKEKLILANKKLVENETIPNIQILTEQKKRVMRVIKRIENLATELSKSPDTKDKSEKLSTLAQSLKDKTNNYYRTIRLHGQEEFKSDLIGEVKSTFKTVGGHRREWAKTLEVAIINGLLFAISIPKRLLTGSWIVKMNTKTQNKLAEAEEDIEKAFKKSR